MALDLNAELLKLLEDGLVAAARGLVSRIQNGEFSAADVAQLRSMAKDAGITLTFQGRPTAVGDDVLASLADVDLDLLN